MSVTAVYVIAGNTVLASLVDSSLNILTVPALFIGGYLKVAVAL